MLNLLTSSKFQSPQVWIVTKYASATGHTLVILRSNMKMALSACERLEDNVRLQGSKRRTGCEIDMYFIACDCR